MGTLININKIKYYFEKDTQKIIVYKYNSLC